MDEGSGLWKYKKGREQTAGTGSLCFKPCLPWKVSAVRTALSTSEHMWASISLRSSERLQWDAKSWAAERQKFPFYDWICIEWHPIKPPHKTLSFVWERWAMLDENSFKKSWKIHRWINNQFLWSCWPAGHNRHPKVTGYGHCSWFTYKACQINSTAKDTTHLSH